MSHRKTIFEDKLFDIILSVGAVFWLIGFVKELFFREAYVIATMDAIQLVISIGALFLIKKGVERAFLINIYCFLWILMFPVFWVLLGGAEGPISYFFFSIIMFYVGLLKRSTRIFLIAILGSMCIMLASGEKWLAMIGIQVVPYDKLYPIAIDFVFNSLIVAIVIVYVKVNFDRKREDIEAHNLSLEALTEEMNEQSNILLEQQKEIQQIQSNLEVLVHDRTFELEKKKLQLEEYAYDNVHHVRAPLTNILGVVDLIHSTEELRIEFDESAIKDVMKHAKELDEVVMKINTVLK